VSVPADPNEPVIASGEDLKRALAERFLANASAGDDGANDDLVQQIGEARRGRGAR